MAPVWKNGLNNLPLSLDGVGGKTSFLVCLGRAYYVLSIFWSINFYVLCFKFYVLTHSEGIVQCIYRSTKIQIIIKREFFKKIHHCLALSHRSSTFMFCYHIVVSLHRKKLINGSKGKNYIVIVMII